MSLSDTSSVTDSTGETEYEPSFHVLSRFLVTDGGKNIADVLLDLTAEVKALRLALSNVANVANVANVKSDEKQDFT